MKGEFENNWAIILGGSSGLGLASAKKLAAHKMNICIVHRDRKSNLAVFNKEVEAMRAFGVKVITFNKDAMANETIEHIISELPKGSVKLLLHSIAKGAVKPMYSEHESTLTMEDFNITLNAMALSLYDWVKRFITNNMFAKNARILAFTSEGNSKAWRYYGAVSAAKATLEALIRNMAVEYASIGITSNCIQAGVTKTPSFEMIPESEQISEATLKRNPFRRLTTPDDVANVVYLLCRPEADWINGTVIKADGGESIR